MALFRALVYLLLKVWLVAASNSGVHDRHVEAINKQATKSEAAVTTRNLGTTLPGTHYLFPGTTQVIQSQNYPSEYPGELRDNWEFHTSPASNVTIECSDFHLQSSKRCTRDYFKIRDNDGYSKRFCSHREDVLVESTSDTVYIRHKSDSSKSGPGFTCTVTGAETDCRCGTPNRATRVTGGVETEVNEYPWLALVKNTFYTPSCTATLISDQFLITSAICVYSKNPSDLEVYIGVHDSSNTEDATLLPLEEIIIHPDFIWNTMESAIALLKLSTPLNFTEDNSVSPICLPLAMDAYANASATVAGWGNTGASLQEADVLAISHDECFEVYGETLGDDMICTNEMGASVCYGNEGLPLMYNRDGSIEIAAVAFDAQCGTTPTVYTRVSGLMEWIFSYLWDSTTCSP